MQVTTMDGLWIVRRSTSLEISVRRGAFLRCLVYPFLIVPKKDSCFEGAFPQLYSCDSLLPRSKRNSLGALDHRNIFICWPAATRQRTWVAIIFLFLLDAAYSSLGHHCCPRQRGVYGAQSWQVVRPVCTCCDSSFKLIVTQKCICHLLFLEL